MAATAIHFGRLHDVAHLHGVFRVVVAAVDRQVIITTKPA
jgi:hypothetical protein